MKKTSKAFLVVAALTLAACPDDSTTYTAVCEPAPFTTADPTGAESYCIDFYNAVCQRAFSDCVVEIGWSGTFADYSQCSAFWTASCQADDFSSTGLNAGCANVCLATVQTAACAVFDGAEPAECAAATGDVPAPCTAIGLGTIQDTILASDPLYLGSYPSRAYCITFTAGQSVTITTAAPTMGTPIGDTVLYLMTADGTVLASNDDYSGLYSRVAYTIGSSGTYRILVRGFGGALGSYRLTVASP